MLEQNILSAIEARARRVVGYKYLDLALVCSVMAAFGVLLMVSVAPA
jgi:hypothetical protein